MIAIQSNLTRPALFKKSATGETAKAAAAVMTPKAPTLRQRVLDRIRMEPAIPETILADLLAEGVQTVLTSVRPRCSELVRLGLIKDSGRRQKGEGGCNAIVWEACSVEETSVYLTKVTARSGVTHA